MLAVLFSAVLPSDGQETGAKHVMGISTNLPYDLAYVPGYGLTSIPSGSIEIYPGKSRHLTLGADVEWPMWQHPEDHRYLQVNNITLWLRRYFKSRVASFEGTYLLWNANVARYGIGFDEKGWQGEGVGTSLGLGYKKMLGKSRCFFDFGVAFGGFLSRQDPYIWGDDGSQWYYYDYAGDPATFKERNKRFLWGGPTRAYISFGIDLFKRKAR